ncbi:CHAD domain-containing protein [Agromyces seonyuensis]|uniref:CHAD domain-containing protein n=1 Tax=Agromyces seonyuensis TaxID=2662446 RepID=A0A6I4P293_9MICO|nr:CHAD domain-containing protein [Agromyces seonyuensis]MWB98179.1 CHAD domain-containing protein [Agromyces seonyuensis]
MTEGEAAQPLEAGRPDPEDAGAAALVAIAAIVETLDASLGPALLDLPDGVHAHRKAVRRLRSALAAFRPFFDGARVDVLRADYRAWGRELGDVRDAEVRIEFAEHHLAADDPPEARVLLVDDERSARAFEHARLARHGIGPAAAGRRRRLAAFLLEPGRTAVARQPIEDGLRERLVQQGERALDRADAALGASASLDDLHGFRKAARRLRYATEAAAALPASRFGERADRLAAAAEAIHESLGAHRDGVLFAEHVEALPGSGAALEPIAARARLEAGARLGKLPATVDELRAALRAFA